MSLRSRPLRHYAAVALLAGSALLTGGCVDMMAGDGYQSGYDPAYPPIGKKRPDDGYGQGGYSGGGYGDQRQDMARYASGSPESYAWIDRADGFARALGTSAPDVSFDFAGQTLWAWIGTTGDLLIVEPQRDDVFQYFFDADTRGTPYLVRTPECSFGYDRGQLAVSYGPDGALLAAGPPCDARDAAALRARADTIYRAFARSNPNSGGYAGGYGGYNGYGGYGTYNGYPGGYDGWASQILIAPYAPTIDFGWSRGWDPGWRSRRDWDSWRRRGGHDHDADWDRERERRRHGDGRPRGDGQGWGQGSGQGSGQGAGQGSGWGQGRPDRPGRPGRPDTWGNDRATPVTPSTPDTTYSGSAGRARMGGDLPRVGRDGADVEQSTVPARPRWNRGDAGNADPGRPRWNNGDATSNPDRPRWNGGARDNAAPTGSPPARFDPPRRDVPVQRVDPPPSRVESTPAPAPRYERPALRYDPPAPRNDPPAARPDFSDSSLRGRARDIEMGNAQPQ